MLENLTSFFVIRITHVIEPEMFLKEFFFFLKRWRLLSSFVVLVFLGYLFAAGFPGLGKMETEKRIRIFWIKEGERDKGAMAVTIVNGQKKKKTEGSLGDQNDGTVQNWIR